MSVGVSLDVFDAFCHLPLFAKQSYWLSFFVCFVTVSTVSHFESRKLAVIWTNQFLQDQHTCALKTTGQVLCWGSNDNFAVMLLRLTCGAVVVDIVYDSLRAFSAVGSQLVTSGFIFHRDASTDSA